MRPLHAAILLTAATAAAPALAETKAQPVAAAAAQAEAPALPPNRIDQVRPDAPELATRGPHVVGVRTITLTDPGRTDVLATTAEGTVPTADRALTVEQWYPAADGTTPGGTYQALLRDGTTTVTLHGQAARDAAPAASGDHPLVLISHGYPGNRFLLSHLAEHLASHGYVVAAADHPDSTYDDQGPFISTLVNRPVDQAFLIDALLGATDAVGAVTSDDVAGVVGYSMGGYGALILGGAGLSDTALTRTEPAAFTAPQKLLDRHTPGSETLADLGDDRVKAIVAIAPWGRNRDFWDAAGLAAITTPLMLVAGSVDDVSSYDSLRAIFAETTGTTRHLLTFEGANHNAAAPMPAPAEAWLPDAEGKTRFDHYGDAVWDSVRMNNILQHFTLAFLDQHLKGTDRAGFLTLTENAADGVWSMEEDGTTQKADHSYWAGFANRTAAGLRFETKAAGE